MKQYFIILLLFIQYSGSSQELPEYYKKSKSLEAIFPHYNYFDSDFHLSNPFFNLGLKYNINNTIKNRGFYFSSSTNWYRQTPINYGFLTVISREILFNSYGLFKDFKLNKRINIKYFGEINNRLGLEKVFVAKNSFEVILDSRSLVDFGLSIGGEANFRMDNKWYLTTNFKQTYYLFIFDKGTPFFKHYASRNVLTFYLGIGYTFKKSKTQLQ